MKGGLARARPFFDRFADVRYARFGARNLTALEVQVARIASFENRPMERNSVHTAIHATYCVFEKDGKRFVQIDTFGSDQREFPGKKSQTIQMDREAALQLADIILQNFK